MHVPSKITYKIKRSCLIETGSMKAHRIFYVYFFGEDLQILFLLFLKVLVFLKYHFLRMVNVVQTYIGLADFFFQEKS